MKCKSGKLLMMALTGLLAVSVLGVVSSAEEPEKKAKTGKLNGDLWVEVSAQLGYEIGKVTDKYSLVPENPEAGRKALREMEAAQKNVYERFGVTKKEMDAYYEKIGEEDIQRIIKWSQRVAERTQELAEKDRKPEPEPKHVKYLPDIPVFPGAKLNPESTEETVWYEADASEKEVFSFYKDKLSKAGWQCHATKFSLYFIRGDKAYELSMPSGEGEMQYRPLPPKRAIAEGVDLNKDEYIAKVVAFAGKLLPYSQKWLELSKQSPRTPETVEKMFKVDQEIDDAADKIGPEVGVTVDRLKSFGKQYALELMDYLSKHPELKEKGVPRFLPKINYWNDLGSGMEDYLNRNPKEAEKFMKRYQEFTQEWMMHF
ncbi:MAG: hypothetical protein KAY24_12385 [Candidatus Eisenbacteria sp.]|nr:hypothetical protein [Candidatus Eisenbacteria bacterium]